MGVFERNTPIVYFPHALRSLNFNQIYSIVAGGLGVRS